jgi:hypothetical protein
VIIRLTQTVGGKYDGRRKRGSYVKTPVIGMIERGGNSSFPDSDHEQARAGRKAVFAYTSSAALRKDDATYKELVAEQPSE